jgi:hypothetical protein
MRINYLPGTRPTKPWVRRWMVWIVAFAVQFIPGVLASVAGGISDEWANLKSDVDSFDYSKKGLGE